MSSRETTLSRIRAALDGDGEVPGIPRHYRTGTDLEADAVVDLFAERTAEYRATVHRCAVDGLPALLATIIEAAGHTRVVVPAGLAAAWLAEVAGAVTVRTDDGGMAPADLDDVDAVVTGCAVAIAQTGTIVLDAGPNQGRRLLTLLPDHHVCIVDAARIVGTVPEGLALVDPSRPLTMISGPSATSDIELDRVEGVHGPRNLDVVIVAPG